MLGFYGNNFRGHGILLPQRGNLRVARGVIRRVLYEHICRKSGEASVKFGHALERITRNSENGKLCLCFQNGVQVDNVDLVVGADGVRSRLRTEWEKGEKVPEALPVPLDILLIVGVSTAVHPLLKERGFHSMDGRRRLFLMPFEEKKTMWQFSERIDHEEGKWLRETGVDALFEYVKGELKGWHEPVPDLIDQTDIETLWGTSLVDRNPVAVCHKGGKNDVVFIGDAAHAMSPFKGAGANQALMDGVQLVEKVQTGKRLRTAVLNFEREMIQRSRVGDSRRAAGELHSAEALKDENHSFTGLDTEAWSKLREQLDEREIKAAGEIDERIREVMVEVGMECTIGGSEDGIFDEREPERIIEAVEAGDLATVRNISIENPNALKAKTKEGKNLATLSREMGWEIMEKWFVKDVGMKENAT